MSLWMVEVVAAGMVKVVMIVVAGVVEGGDVCGGVCQHDSARKRTHRKAKRPFKSAHPLLNPCSLPRMLPAVMAVGLVVMVMAVGFVLMVVVQGWVVMLVAVAVGDGDDDGGVGGVVRA